MRFLLDESAEFRLAAFLSQQSHDVTSIGHDYPRALSDPAVLAIAYNERRVLITNDRDFGELIVREHLPHAGVIFFRLGSRDLQIKITWLQHVLAEYGDQMDQLLVVTDQGVRVRRTSTRD